MSPTYHPFVKPGVLEVYCGPMNSGKSREIINRVDKINFMDGFDFLFFKPRIDIRGDKKVWSRFGKLSYDCIFVDENNPSDILKHVGEKHNLIIIDEANFFDKKLIPVIKELQLNNKNVVIAGLDLDFRGETFGPMGDLLAMADEVIKLQGICEFEGCTAPATRTQRLINGEPAPYDSPIIMIGAKEEGYQCRCLKHHYVPKD